MICGFYSFISTTTKAGQRGERLCLISFDAYLHLKTRCKLGLKWIGLKTIRRQPSFFGISFSSYLLSFPVFFSVGNNGGLPAPSYLVIWLRTDGTRKLEIKPRQDRVSCLIEYDAVPENNKVI